MPVNEKMRPRRYCAVNARRVPVAVRDQFKAFCARKGYTMEAALVALMRQAVDRDVQLPSARRPYKTQHGPKGG